MSIRDRLLDLAVDAVLRAVERRQRQPRAMTLIVRSPKTGEAWLMLHSATTGSSMLVRAHEFMSPDTVVEDDDDPIVGPATIITLPGLRRLVVSEPVIAIEEAAASLHEGPGALLPTFRTRA